MPFDERRRTFAAGSMVHNRLAFFAGLQDLIGEAAVAIVGNSFLAGYTFFDSPGLVVQI